jgi:hypothetical protein
MDILKKTFLTHEPILQIWIWIRKDPKYVARSISGNVALDTQHCQKKLFVKILSMILLSNQWFNIVTTQYLFTECTGKKGVEYRHMWT